RRCQPGWADAHRQFDLTGGAFAALQSQLECLLQSLGEAGIHFEQLLAGPRPILLVSWFVQGVVAESHGRAAWRSGADKSITLGPRVRQCAPARRPAPPPARRRAPAAVR